MCKLWVNTLKAFCIIEVEDMKKYFVLDKLGKGAQATVYKVQKKTKDGNPAASLLLKSGD